MFVHVKGPLNGLREEDFMNSSTPACYTRHTTQYSIYKTNSKKYRKTKDNKTYKISSDMRWTKRDMADFRQIV